MLAITTPKRQATPFVAVAPNEEELTQTRKSNLKFLLLLRTFEKTEEVKDEAFVEAEKLLSPSSQCSEKATPSY